MMNSKEVEGYEGKTIDIKTPKAIASMHFVIKPSILDCLGCSNCVDIYPDKSLTGMILTIRRFIFLMLID